MKYEIYIIICLITLVIGVVGIFYSADIADKCRKIKKKTKFIQIAKNVGYIIVIISLCFMYILRR